MALTSSFLDLKWYSSPPLETSASLATASSVSACAPSRWTTVAAASRSLSLVRAGGIEADHADDDERERGELERAGRLAVGGDADQGDRGGAGGGPDRVRRADAQVLEDEREQPERDAVADHDERDRHGSGEAVGVLEGNSGHDLGGDGRAEDESGHAIYCT